jgi:uncharacterized protein with ParB-like and HNH nuclease domain
MSKEMKANELTVQKNFGSSVFHIPYYQRPYSWGVEDCDVLWSDLIQHFGDDPEDTYFLGVVVLAKNNTDKYKVEDNTDDVFDVIDGQQRLTTLSLLLRALVIKDKTKQEGKAIRKCLYRLTEDDEKFISIRLKSDSGNQEQKQLEHWLSEADHESEADQVAKSNHETNYAFFRKQINDEFKDDPGKRTAFAAFVRNKVVLLQVVCQDEHSALTIFETINNRGKNLTNGDIFKAKIAQTLKDENEISEFSKRWDVLVDRVEWLRSRNESSITLLFRYYMHLLRGQHQDKTKLVGLREFFDGNVLNDKKQKDKRAEYILTNPKRHWTEILATLEGLADTLSILNETDDTELRIWQHILNAFGNDIWKFPVSIFLYQHKKEWENESQQSKIKSQCVLLMHNIARYIYAKGFGSNTIKGSSIEDAMFALIRDVVAGELYDPEIEITDQFMQKLDSGLTAKIRRGFSAIIEFAQPKRIAEYINRSTIAQRQQLEKAVDVEHILPKNWEKNNYKWKEDKVKSIMDTIGNLMLLEKPINIGGTDHFFSKKLEGYCKPILSEPLALCQKATDSKNNKWEFKDYQERQDYCKEKLKNFFEGKYAPTQDAE